MLPAGLVVGSLVAVVMLAEEDGRGRSKGDGTLMGLVAALAALVLLAGVTLGALALFGVDSELLPGVTVNVSRWITWSIVVVGILVFSVPGALDAVLKVLLELPENILDWLSPDLHKRHRYHDWMTSALRALGLGGFVASLFFVFMATAGSERASGQGAEESSVSAVVDASTVIGPFALGEPCFSDEVRLAQVDALLREARAQGASTVELRGGVDLVPVVGDGDGFRSNAGLSYARARCVAGWIAQRSLAHGLRIELRGGEGTGARSAPGQAGSRVVTARFLVGASRDPP
ncbi:MAG: hypothetical protein D6701_07615 [Gemmatimonadetes bacterium]|nr:MAG: hypothetical protein D6701_07615 [Gemmatimonadota bacterium]